MTVELCLSVCRQKGFRFCGLQWQIECFCGEEPEHGFKWTWADKCSDRCAGNSHQKCGGSNAMSVYSTHIEDGLCIYDYPAPHRVLADYAVTNHRNMTIENCQTICDGKYPINLSFKHLKYRPVNKMKSPTIL